ncbi:T9SS type A sorting domain-containing protein [Winogradskyella thalassocola]|uniref:Por secretion system C-terminal sorting domain-containing protein n=1 Tax=Winogradskyella thalassocola TaxID=262004 RepID=A0A1G8BW95_9FLAO|nr:T9SS type A sorting domain-containing protein [Winogradskyella thalassocola]SDH37418.1 Por secretion system C-terminal sorting domain-containing protein [Winogradskyella thalassocola]
MNNKTTKQLIIFFCFLFFIKNINAQDSNLYGTWYLHQLEADLDGVVWDYEDVQPDYIPQLTINTDLTFEGVGACNGFSGYYTYDAEQNTLTPNSFVQSLAVCDTSEEINLEYLFFSQVSANTSHSITLNSNADFTQLRLENYPGFAATYRNVSLSNSDQILSELKIYPNPVLDNLFIAKRNSEVLDIVVYDIYGDLVLREKAIEGSVDVSILTEGIYFIEINSENGRRIQKIIKA